MTYQQPNRRDFLKTAGAATAVLVGGQVVSAAADDSPKPAQTAIPRWRGFNLVNEAPVPREGYMSREDYVRVMSRVADAIRRHSPDRLVHIDGLSVGREPVEGMISKGVAQSVHAYWPGGISRCRASWVDRNSSFPMPSWPLKDKNGRITANRQKLEELYAPWAELARKGVGVHCGECGCYNKTERVNL